MLLPKGDDSIKTPRLHPSQIELHFSLGKICWKTRERRRRRRRRERRRGRGRGREVVVAEGRREVGKEVRKEAETQLILTGNIIPTQKPINFPPKVRLGGSNLSPLLIERGEGRRRGDEERRR